MELLRIYRFDYANGGERWIGLYPNEYFNSYSFPCDDLRTLKSIIKTMKSDSPEEIVNWLNTDFGKLAKECWESKHEDKLVWTSKRGAIEHAFTSRLKKIDEEIDEILDEKPICTCPDENFSMKTGFIGCRCGAAQKERNP